MSSNHGSFLRVIFFILIVGLGRLLPLFLRLECQSRRIRSVRRTTHHQLTLAFDRDDMNKQGERRCGDDEQSQCDLNRDNQKNPL